MPRSFTVTFTHNRNVYTAVVTQLQSSVSVYLPDERLHDILPHGRFCYDAGQGPNIDATKRSPVQHLMLDVLAAIELQSQTQNSGHV